jgi:hypothetical protein
MFFALAFLLPLVGGGTLLYFLSKPKRATTETSETKEPKEK